MTRIIWITLVTSGLAIVVLLASFHWVYTSQDVSLNTSKKIHASNDLPGQNLSLKSLQVPEAADSSFGNMINLSSNKGHSEVPKIVAYGNYLYVVWMDDSSGNRDIYFRRSTDNGTTFNETTNLSNRSGGSSDPHMVASGNNVYVVWEHTPGNNGEIFFTRSTDYGLSFEKASNVGNNSGFNGFPRVAASGSNVYLVWHDSSNGILFKRSSDNGASFKKPITLTKNDTLSFHPQIVAMSGSNNLYIVWIKPSAVTESTYDIVFRRSTDNGASFEKPITLSKKDRLSFHPQIVGVSGSNNLHVVWYNGTVVDIPTSPRTFITDIIYTRSVDNGASFEKLIVLDNYTGWSITPQIAVSQNDNVNVVWENNPQEKNGEIVFSRSTDNGASFENPIVLSNKSTDSSYPQIAVSQNDNVNVVWENNPQEKNGEIVFSRSTDNGASFENPIVLSNKSTDSSYPQIAVSQNDNVNVVWEENGTQNKEIIILKRTTNKDAASEHISQITSFGNVTSVNSKSHKTINVAVVHPTFTDAAYDKSFYIFYNGGQAGLDISANKNNTKYTNLLSSEVNKRREWSALVSSMVIEHLKWLSPQFNVTLLKDEDVHSNISLFTEKRANKYDVIILGHQEYVTQQEYDHLKQFIENGGLMILLNGNVFYAEVKYDSKSNTITLVRGHGWTFDGKYASKSVNERWANETSEWVGSNYCICYSDVIGFFNNPFDYTHNEEQYITNPSAKILLNYNATVLYDDPNNSTPNKPTIATYELNYKKGKVITIGLTTHEQLLRNDRFLRFFDSVLLKNTLEVGETGK